MSGQKTIAIVINAKNFSDATEINYYITNIEDKYVTPEGICSTYSQRNWVEVFYREAKGWLGLREYQLTDQISLKRNFILV
ncbi:MAG: transposase [Okeania sp. SIO2C9]|uniref:transposase n=1 Tax=Okeania sp. SIO2C9 TaxID=2607791 RepID=UPI0013BFC448|nr:transposase [Okeania sp. SIO2C9]NEQ78141.1 transposase [Okeania sp. SIO2C9]